MHYGRASANHKSDSPESDKIRKRFSKNVIYLMTVSMPFLITMIQSAICKMNLFMGKPHNLDEFCYWRVLYSFSKCGFNFASTCGYLNSDAPIGPLGEHGLATLLTWGGSLILGMNEHTLFLWNFIVLTAALGIFLFFIKPDVKTALWIILLIAGNGVILEQWYSHMMEFPCLAIIIVYFAFQIMYEREGRSLYAVIAALICIYASYMRVCYIILAFPLVITLCRKYGKKFNPLPFLGYLVAFIVIRDTQSLFMKNSESFLTDIAEMGTVEKIEALISNFTYNFVKYFSLCNGDPIEIGQRYYQIILLIVLLSAACIRVKDRKLGLIFRWDCITTALALMGLILMMMALYDIDQWRDVRTTMPYATGVTIWFIDKCNDKNHGLDILSGKIAQVLIFCGICATLLIFVPHKYATNHPMDRYNNTKLDTEWTKAIPDKNIILCLFQPELDSERLFALYQELPPHVGVLNSRDYDEFYRSQQEIEYILASESISLKGYELWETNSDFGFIYRKSNQ